MSLHFLLEIGTEEIPDWMITTALNQLQDMFQVLLDQHALGGENRVGGGRDAARQHAWQPVGKVAERMAS